MNKILRILFCCFVVIITFSCISCSDDSNENESANTLNEEYYSALGYHTIEFDSYLTISCEDENMITINSQKVMVPNNTNITLNFDTENNDNFVKNNKNFINFSEGTILSGFIVNENHIDIENATIKVKENLTISSNIISFEIVGLAYDQIVTATQNNIDCSGKFNSITDAVSTLKYFYTSSCKISEFNNSKVTSNGTQNLSASQTQDSKFKLDAEIEIYIETIDINLYFILKDSNNNFYLIETDKSKTSLTSPFTLTDLSSQNCKLDQITISLSTDITTKNEY